MKNTYILTEKVIDRLADRGRLLAVAYEIGCHFNESIADCYCAEQDVRVSCYPNNNGMNDLIFSCSSKFDSVKCGNAFFCNKGTITYTSCQGANDVQCDQSGSTQFECKSGNKSANYYDCSTFDCNKSSGASAFDCNAVVDHRCLGDEFKCDNGYTCSAGHGFFCYNEHNCDKFECAGGTTKGCPPDGGGTGIVAVSCTPKPGMVQG